MLGQRLKTKITAQERATVGGILRPAKAHSKTTEAMIAARMTEGSKPTTAT